MQVDPDSYPWGHIFAIYKQKLQDERAKELVRVFVHTLQTTTEMMPNFKKFKRYCQSGSSLTDLLVKTFGIKARDVLLQCVDDFAIEMRKTRLGLVFDQTTFRVLCYVAGSCVSQATDRESMLDGKSLKKSDPSFKKDWQHALDEMWSYKQNDLGEDCCEPSYTDEKLEEMFEIERHIYLGYSGKTELPRPRECPPTKLATLPLFHEDGLTQTESITWRSFMNNEL